MKLVFEHLVELQRVDTDLATLKARMDDLPRRIARLQEEAERVRTELESTRQAIVDHRKDYRLAEVDLKAAEDRINSYSVQLYSAKTNEQYKAFLKEIEAQKKLKSRIEDRMIVLLEEAERLEARRRAVEQAAGQVEAETGRKVAALEAERQEVTTAVAEREQCRTKLLGALPPNVVALYERIRKSKGGLAVVTTHNERCNGCYNPIPAQRLLEIARQDRIHTCEACGRILVPDRS